jgi:RsiW-degrading membrane proteinase PrsW (M82 family)
MAIPTVVSIGVQLAFMASADVVATILAVVLTIGSAAVVLALIRFGAHGWLPPSGAVAALVWGALAAPFVAVVATIPWSNVLAGSIGEPSTPWSESVIAGPIEEPTKLLGLALLAVAWPGSVRGVRAGLVAGMLVGLGFETVEHLSYLAGLALLGADTGSAVEVTGWVFAARALGSGLFLHVAFTGLAGAALGWLLERPSARRGLALVGTLAAVAALHSIANAGPIGPPDVPWEAEQIGAVIAASLVRSLPFFVLVALLAWLGAGARVSPEPAPDPAAGSAP